MTTGCSDVCEVVDVMLQVAGFDMNDDEDHGDMLGGLAETRIIKDEFVPMVRVHLTSDDQDQYIAVTVEVPFTGSEPLISTALSIFAGTATPQQVQEVIWTAEYFATQRNYRISVEVDPKDFEDLETGQYDCMEEN